MKHGLANGSILVWTSGVETAPLCPGIALDTYREMDSIKQILVVHGEKDVNCSADVSRRHPCSRA